MFEDSDSFRHDVGLERYGVNPTLTIAASDRTRVTLGYEYLHDTRTADRGITSFQGRPADVDISTFYGNPAVSHVRAGSTSRPPRSSTVGRAHAAQPHDVGDYDRFYQNFVPGAVTRQEPGGPDRLQQRDAARQRVQPDGRHLPGLDRPHEAHPARRRRARPPATDNFRNTGFFNNTTTSILVPYATRRSDARDVSPERDRRRQPPEGDGGGRYAQDQVELSRRSRSWAACASTAST